MSPSSFLPVWLPRKTVVRLVGGRSALRLLEVEGRLRRAHPAGLKQARYFRDDVLRVAAVTAQKVT